MKKRVYLIFLFILIYSFSVNAIIISPTERNYDFQPGYNYSFSFVIGGNKGSEPIKVESYAKGDLAQYVVMHQKEGNILPGQWTEFTGNIVLPEKLKPGYHDNRVGVVEIGAKKTGFAAIVGVEMILGVRVPYPGRYIENALEVNDIMVNETANFILTFHNYGSENLSDVKSNIEIFGIDGENIDKFDVESFDIISGDTKKIEVKWSTIGRKIGIYKAVLNSDYGGDEIAVSEKIFRIGDILIEIVSLNNTKIIKGKINRVLINTRSFWNTRIDNVYGMLEINTPNGLMQIKSETVSYTPWQNLDLQVYVDGNKIDIGDYNTKAIVFYANRTTEKQFTLNVVENKLDNLFNVRNLLILIVIILIIIMIFNFRRFMKKK